MSNQSRTPSRRLKRGQKVIGPKPTEAQREAIRKRLLQTCSVFFTDSIDWIYRDIYNATEKPNGR